MKARPARSRIGSRRKRNWRSPKTICGQPIPRSTLRAAGCGLSGVPRMKSQRLQDKGIISRTATITAPIAGTVVARKVGPGQYVRSDTGDPLYIIADLSSMWLKAFVPENDIPAIRIGQDVDVKVLALPERVFKARVVAIGAASDSNTRRVVVRSEVAKSGWHCSNPTCLPASRLQRAISRNRRAYRLKRSFAMARKPRFGSSRIR